MSQPTLLPDPSLIHVDYLSARDDTVTLVATVVQAQPHCPDCQHPAHRLHSHYHRTLADQPWKSVHVRLRLRTRRWFCDQPACVRRIFTERLPGLARRSARRTDRLTELLRHLGMALGGEAGARLAAELGLTVSPDTVLHQVKQAGSSSGPAPRVLGVDDFAFKRGHRYGTILVDLERGEPVDLLPDRRAETLAAWLREHPGVEIVTRDRGGAYANGVRHGAPNAQQVADRWHLLKNLAAALEATLTREHRALREAAQPSGTAREAAPSDRVAAAARALPEVVTPATPSAPPLPAGERRQTARQEQKAARCKEVARLHREGVHVQQIARATGLDRKTVRRYLAAGGVPERRPRGPRPNQLTPFEGYLRDRWAAGCHNATQLWREIRERGFLGGRSAVKALLTTWRSGGSAAGDPTMQRQAASGSPRTVVWWLLGAQRSEAQTSFVARLEALCPAIRQARTLILEFFTMVRRREAAELHNWIQRANAAGLPELRSFCAGLHRDWEAVIAGLTLPWSNGPVEGQVNRLKLIKRSMYGRASFALLRARVLPSR